MSAAWGRADFEHSLVQVCFSPIVLKKSILIEFSGPLVRLRATMWGTSISAKATIDELTRRPLLFITPLSGHSDMAGLAVGSTQSRLTPKRTVDPSAILTARASFRSCSRFPICLHSQTGAGLFRPLSEGKQRASDAWRLSY